jgi:hypothetical protein
MNLTERSLKFEIFDFMELVDLPLKDYEDDHNDWFENEFGEEERYALGEMVDYQDPTQYELIWQTHESMRRFFWPLSASTLLSLPHLIERDIVCGNVIDIGSGMGFAACFMAWKWRDCHVTAVEQSANGNIRAREMAKRAGLHNITFVESSLQQFPPNHGFDLVTSFLTAHEVGSLNKLHEIYGDESHSDEFARINLEKYQSDYGQFIGDLLNDQGSFFSLERLGGTAEQCAWIGGLRNSGVFIDLEQSTFVYPYQAAWGHRERLPVFVGSRQETDLSMGNFENWFNRYPFGNDVD